MPSLLLSYKDDIFSCQIFCPISVETIVSGHHLRSPYIIHAQVRHTISPLTTCCDQYICANHLINYPTTLIQIDQKQRQIRELGTLFPILVGQDRICCLFRGVSANLSKMPPNAASNLTRIPHLLICFYIALFVFNESDIQNRDERVEDFILDSTIEYRDPSIDHTFDTLQITGHILRYQNDAWFRQILSTSRGT